MKTLDLVVLWLCDRQARTTTQMISVDGAQTLAEADTKSNRPIKCWTINGGGQNPIVS
jgi:hypothetical protein